MEGSRSVANKYRHLLRTNLAATATGGAIGYNYIHIIFRVVVYDKVRILKCKELTSRYSLPVEIDSDSVSLPR